jgi:hypothetical protein
MVFCAEIMRTKQGMMNMTPLKSPGQWPSLAFSEEK